MTNVGVILGMPVLQIAFKLSLFSLLKTYVGQRGENDKWGVRVALDEWRLWFTSYLTDWILCWVNHDFIHPH